MQTKDEIQVEARWLLAPSDAREVKDFLERKNLESSQVKGDPNLGAYFLNAGQVEQLLELARLNAGYKCLPAPRLEVVDGESGLISLKKRVNFICGYSEPNSPLDEPQPKHDSVDTGVSLQVKPKLQLDSQDAMAIYFRFEMSNIRSYKKFMYKGKYPYETPIIQRNAVSVQYTIAAGQTLLLCGWKITDRDDGRTEQKDLLVLVTAQKVEPKNA